MARTAGRRGKGGNAYRSTGGHLFARASTPRGPLGPTIELHREQCVFSSVAKISALAFPKRSQMTCISAGWIRHSPGLGPPLDKSRLLFCLLCSALRDTPWACAHKRISWAFLCRDIERTPPWWFTYDTTVVLTEQTITYFSWSWGRKWIKARNTASSSNKFMCSPIHEALSLYWIASPDSTPACLWGICCYGLPWT